MKQYLCIVCLTLLLAKPSRALVQPDISAIGDFRVYTGNWKNLDSTKTDRNGNLNMNLEELEVALSAYLNPYAKGDFIIATSGDGTVDVEEGYVNFVRGLPLKSQLRAGKYLVDFGKLNSNHAHAYDFIFRPLSHQVYFGAEGFKDVGVNYNVLLPTTWYTKLSLNALAGQLFESETGNDRSSVKPMYSGRLSCFLPVGEKGNLDIGISGLTGVYMGRGGEGAGDSAAGFRDLRCAMWALDAKYKIRWSDYSYLILQAELIGNRRDVFNGSFKRISNTSKCAFIDYRFRKRYNIGAMVDVAPGIFDDGAEMAGQDIPDSLNNTRLAAFDTKNSTRAITVFAGFSLLEETTLIRLAGRFLSFDIDDSLQLANTNLTNKAGESSITLQLLWSMGPHKPHEF